MQDALSPLLLSWPAWLGPLAMFALASSITPGPNNTMLAASGLNYGFRRTVPHMLGVSAGFSLMIVLVGLGLGGLFARWPWLYTLLKYAGALYLLYLAWKIARAGAPATGTSNEKPISVLQAMAFQWVNPKAWVMVIGVVATYTPRQGFFANLLLAALLCAIINLPSVGLWAGFGSVMRRWLHDARVLRGFNLGMALLLVLSLYPLLGEWLHG